jgi:hypothetical protein
LRGSPFRSGLLVKPFFIGDGWIATIRLASIGPCGPRDATQAVRAEQAGGALTRRQIVQTSV